MFQVAVTCCDVVSDSFVSLAEEQQCIPVRWYSAANALHKAPFPIYWLVSGDLVDQLVLPKQHLQPEERLLSGVDHSFPSVSVKLPVGVSLRFPMNISAVS